jgi:ectoine hydroxylase-related dioxygenase (phytanoyl-CoA dioxygenase family)
MQGFLSASDCDLDAFKALCSQNLDPQDVPYSAVINANVPIYDCAALAENIDSDEGRRKIMAEWSKVLMDLSGVIVLRGAYQNTDVIDLASDVFHRIIADEKQTAKSGADHFAASGANDRIWNSLQKLCLNAPYVHVNYFANPFVDAACEAWLGPHYQMTAQVNLVRPGGQAQTAHRDYHLGFQSVDKSVQFPDHVHQLSPVLTLQGGIAHCDMPIESGPTKLLPFSQKYLHGYLAYHQEDFKEYFEENYVQLELNKGDVIFFSPAIFHAAGENKSADIQRLVNLLQVSSAFGRAMESIDRDAMCRAVFQSLKDAQLTPAQRHAAIAATAEGYSFPTNLDSDPPIGGLAPKTQAQILTEAVDQGMANSEFENLLDALNQRRDP